MKTKNSFKIEILSIYKTNQNKLTRNSSLTRWKSESLGFVEISWTRIKSHVVFETRLSKRFKTNTRKCNIQRRLQVQELLTRQILGCINKILQPKTLAVVIEGSHMHIMMRGVQKQNSTTTISGLGELLRTKIPEIS